MPARARPPARSRASQAAIVLASVLFVVTAAVAAYSVQREEMLRREVMRSYDARQSLSTLFSLVQDAETGQRGYLLTGDRAFLQPYLAARARMEEGGRRAASYFADEPPAAARIERILQLMAMKLAELQQTLRLADAGRREESLALVREGQGRLLMQELRDAIGELSTLESARLESRRAARQRVREWMLGAGSALIVLLLVLSSLGLVRERRMRREQEALEGDLKDRATRLSAIFDNASDGIITLNPSGSIETVNPAAARMFGYAPEELQRRDVSVLAEVAEQGFGTFHQRLVSGDATLDEGVIRAVTARRKDGQSFPVDVALRGMPLPDGVHVVAIVRDITERRRAEALKEEFVATVSHELRTPLTSIAGALGLVRSGAAGVLPERAARLVQIAETNSARLVRLINNILDIEKLEAGEVRLELAPVSLNELARRAVDAMSGLADQRGLGLQVASSAAAPIVTADADRLMQVLTNLLSNAIKICDPGQTIRLVVTATEDTARVAVIDQGPGVPDRFRPRLFQKFAQADGSDAKVHGGTGLGLAIAREIAQRHGGQLTFSPTPGGGATFCLELPLATGLSPKPQPSQGGGKLLVCEDDPITADYLRDELTRLGHQVDVVGGANEARLALHTGDYRALLLDVGLPDVDGLTLVRALRAAPATRDLPIVIISGEVDDREDGRLLDLIDWIDKPVDLGRLSEALQIALVRSPRKSPLILHVDDDRDLLEVTRTALGGAGEVVTAESLAQARKVLQARRPDVVILDLGLPDGSGVDLLPELTELEGSPVPVIIYTAQEPGSGLDTSTVRVFTKSRVGLQRLADAVTRITGSPSAGEP